MPDLHVKRNDEGKKGSFDPAGWNCPLSVENLLRNNGPSLFVDHHRRPITRRDGILLRIQTTPFYIYYIYIHPLHRTNPLKSKLTLGRRPLPKIFSSIPLTLHPPSRISYVLHLPPTVDSLLLFPPPLSQTRFHIDHDDSQRIIPRKLPATIFSDKAIFFFFFLNARK